jgi:hypothetical protein
MLFVFLTLMSCDLFGQEKQLIVQVPFQSEYNIYKIKKQLNCLEGIHFSGYAKDASCLLLRYNTDVIADQSIITTVIHHLNQKVKCKVIEGYTAYDVIDGKLKKPQNSKK